ncbi:low molecular weight protein-tyrosine-phosphatase [Cupriavidus oxalaticus]|uniref:protein-tyrosine-phosphatase n=1 Tax=Cupriavidus oxalaticus TaxID=96344 RepID=A0A5P3VGW2_9BURK|nr:low molecular weight protein-tyrosine-phosphatase [Cupriavidus oxalaticus]QEZ44069.1 low molecular weight phosphotyrosine protein phosphatase [Cupriavidus oxalaticus]
MVKTILVVCIGNICRSPMAAHLLQQALPGCSVSSAGLAPPVGAPADPRAARLLAGDGISLHEHRARAISTFMVNTADLVLVMDNDQRDELEFLFPQARGKTFRLCEFLKADVPDPYGCSMSMFTIVLELIKQGIASWSVQIEATAPINTHGEAS